MKDVLEYTKEQLEVMSTEQLEKLELEAENKESFYNTQQLVEKTLINSLYGALGNKYFPLFNEDMAAAITGNGRYFIRKLANMIEYTLQKMNPINEEYIIYGDTDSIYYHIEPFINMYIEKNPGLDINEYVDWSDKFEIKVIQPVIKQCIAEFAEQLNSYDAKIIGVAREIISDAAVFTAKKKYFARVRDSEGTRYPANDPYIKVMGLEIATSGIPPWVKTKLNSVIPLILDKTESEVKAWFKETKSEYTSVALNDIAKTGSVNNMQYTLGEKGIPIGARSALVHNAYIKEKCLDNKYSPIHPGDKCKRLFLVKNNPFDSNIIAYTNELFVQEVKDYIDYDVNFEKNFLSPLKIMTDPLQWDMTVETKALDDW